MSVAFAVQMKGFEFLLWPSMCSLMAMMSHLWSWKPPRRSRLWVRSQQQRSTRLSRDAKVGVKHTWNRLVDQKEEDRLLKDNWTVPGRQIETSLLLADTKWKSRC